MMYSAVIENSNSQKNKSRKGKVIWFNPSHSIKVKTNFGKAFLKLIKNNFTGNNSFHRIFNKHTIKITYSCMRNISSIIASHAKFNLRLKTKEIGFN